ncbi:hypothetical protein HPB50_023575 [Hyalomma asiaticum]|uniref:Uncharacterized protein n=1 Tax=Hyalomma asiaticum TaxID=266040 RepID=A0ACB7TA76_HYAAI|nr:hypothetical protein HPB50_023575 [Hyalomma asiaticum]
MADSRDPEKEERPMITHVPISDVAEVKATQTSPHADSSPGSSTGSPFTPHPTAAMSAVPRRSQPWTPPALPHRGDTKMPTPRKRLHSPVGSDKKMAAYPECTASPPSVQAPYTAECAHGMYYALFGPTVQDLAVTLDVGLFRVLFLLAARGTGYFLGAVAGGVLLRPVNPQVLLAVLDFFLAMACLGVSYFDTLFQSELLFGLGGFALGAINVVGVLWMSSLWREASAFLLQTLSFMHCMGCTLAPVLGQPFLKQRSVFEPPSDMSPAVKGELAYLTSLEDKDYVYVAYAYWVVALYVFVVVFLALIAFFVDPRHQDLRAMETQCPVAPCSGIVVVLFLYLFASAATEIVYSQLVAAFALLLGHNKTVAAYLTSTFWAAFSTVRGVSMVWLQQHDSFNVLLFANALLLGLTAFDSVLGYNTRVMWIGTALAGACVAPVMPSTLLLLHDHSGVSVGRFTLAVLAVGSSSALAPLCLGAQLERRPMLFHYALGALAAVSLLLVLVGRTLARRHGYARLPAGRG